MRPQREPPPEAPPLDLRAIPRTGGKFASVIWPARLAEIQKRIAKGVSLGTAVREICGYHALAHLKLRFPEWYADAIKTTIDARAHYTATHRAGHAAFLSALHARAHEAELEMRSAAEPYRLRLAAILTLRSGGWTYDQIGALFGVSHERIRQILRTDLAEGVDGTGAEKATKPTDRRRRG